MLSALFKYSFLQNAFLGAIIASILCGIIGTIIVEKKMVMMSGGIAHTAFGGIGLGYFLGIEPIIGALFFSTAAALGAAAIKKKSDTNTDIIMGIFWSMGMAAGILFIAFTPGYPPDMASYLFGDILTIRRVDLWIMAALCLVTVLTVALFFNSFKAYLFDEEFAYIMKIKTQVLEYITYAMIAFTVVVLIRVVGIILLISLLTAPPAIARMFSYNLKKIMLLSMVLGILFCIFGLWVSYELEIASGAAIVLIAGFTYIAASLLRRLNIAKTFNRKTV